MIDCLHLKTFSHEMKEQKKMYIFIKLTTYKSYKCTTSTPRYIII